jgi:hypothetical protein
VYLVPAVKTSDIFEPTKGSYRLENGKPLVLITNVCESMYCPSGFFKSVLDDPTTAQLSKDKF